MFDDVTVARFWGKVDKHGPDGCWLWTGPRMPLKKTGRKGYGHFAIGGKSIVAHRYSYQIFMGPIPDGLVLDHLCRVHECVNPSHLEAVTNKENILRGTAPTAANAQKTHCKKGHPLSGDNLIIRPRQFGNSMSITRVCKACKRAVKNASQLRMNAKRRAAK